LLAGVDAVAAAVRLAVGGALTVELALIVVDGVILPVPLPLCVGVPDDVDDGVPGGVPLPESELLPVFEPVAPRDRLAVGDALREVESDAVVVGVTGGVGVPLCDAVGVCVCVGVPDDEVVGVVASDPVAEGLAPRVSELVGLHEIVGLPLSVGVAEFVGVPEGVGDVDGVLAAVLLCDTVPDTLAPGLSDAETVDDSDALRLPVLVAVPVAV